jgi:KaiC/GvpD/RAD55 family RecA-like ATPase
MVMHHSKNWNMEGDKLVLIAYHMLESRIGTYIEWLVNKLMMTANKSKYKDARLVMLSADTITHKLDSLAYPWSLCISSCRVSLAEYNRVLRVYSTYCR